MSKQSMSYLLSTDETKQSIIYGQALPAAHCINKYFAHALGIAMKPAQHTEGTHKHPAGSTNLLFPDSRNALTQLAVRIFQTLTTPLLSSIF